MLRLASFVVLLVLCVSGCAVGPPPGPSIAVLPGQNKDWSQFQQDEAACRQYASQYAGLASPQDAANQNTAGSAAVGTLLGGAAGAAIGAATGNPAAGAAIGATSGLVFGGAAGLSAAPYAAGQVQRRYDAGYLQCMYANGNQVPGVAAAAPGEAAGGQQSNCREFTETVTVGGEPRQAFGRACRQPDGSWRIAQETAGSPTQTYVLPPAPVYYPAYPYWAYDPWFYGPPFGFGASFLFASGFHHHHHHGGAFHHGGMHH
jgi:surface antigen